MSNGNIPTGLNIITINQHRARIKWETFPEDGFYSRVYESELPTGPFIFIEETKPNYRSMIVTGLTERFYKVSSVRVSDGVESAQSSETLKIDFGNQDTGNVDDDLVFKGDWDPNTNAPGIADNGVGGNKGDFYAVSVDSTLSIDGISDWKVGDILENRGTYWAKQDNSDSVESINGQEGNVVLDFDTKTFTELAGENLSSHIALVMNPSGTALVHADSSDISHTDKIVGISITSALLGENIVVQKKGDITANFWNWNLVDSIYINSFGALTQVAPTSGFPQIVGIPLSPTSMRMTITSGVVLL